MEWPGARGRPSPSSPSLSPPGSRTKGKRAAAAGRRSDKPRLPQRGLGVAQLEKMRMQSEMAEYFHRPPPGRQPPPSPATTGALAAGSPSSLLEDAVSSSSPPSSSPYPIIHPNLVMAYHHHGEAGDMIRCQSTPIIRSAANYHGSFYGASSSWDGGATLPLFEHDGSAISFKGRQEEHLHLHLSQPPAPADSPAGSLSSDDPPEVNLELKL